MECVLCQKPEAPAQWFFSRRLKTWVSFCECCVEDTELVAFAKDYHG